MCSRKGVPVGAVVTRTVVGLWCCRSPFIRVVPRVFPFNATFGIPFALGESPNLLWSIFQVSRSQWWPRGSDVRQHWTDLNIHPEYYVHTTFVLYCMHEYRMSPLQHGHTGFQAVFVRCRVTLQVHDVASRLGHDIAHTPTAGSREG